VSIAAAGRDKFVLPEYAYMYNAITFFNDIPLSCNRKPCLFHKRHTSDHAWNFSKQFCIGALAVHTYTHIYIYIYMHTERERERERECGISTCVCDKDVT